MHACMLTQSTVAKGTWLRSLQQEDDATCPLAT